MHYYDGHWGGMHLVWWIIWIALIVWIFFSPFQVPYRKNRTEDPLQILKKRFAKGEITKEEYEDSKRTLEDGK